MNNTTRKPKNFFEYNGKEIMSNCDGLVIEQTSTEIKGKELFSRYSGWNFNGLVWWQDNKWCCEVWCYRNWCETIICNTLKDVMEAVSSKYGYE